MHIKSLPLVLACLSGAVFFTLAALLVLGHAQAFDEAFLVMLRDTFAVEGGQFFWWLSVVVNDFTHLGSIPVLSLIVLVTFGAVMLGQSATRALLFLVYAAGGLGVNLLMKGLFSRPRPEVVDHLSTVYTSSFPSSHAMVTTIVLLGVGMVVARSFQGEALRTYTVIVAGLLVFFMGVSRLYLGVHYPSDVLAGWSAGLVWFCVWWLVLRKMESTPQTE